MPESPARYRRHPYLLGLLEGTTAAACGILLRAVFPGFPAEWLLLLFVALGFLRPLEFQATVLLVPALGVAALSGLPWWQGLAPALGALLLANRHSPAAGAKRWRSWHFVFAVEAAAGYFAVAGLMTGSLNSLIERVLTTAIVLLAAAGLLVIGRISSKPSGGQKPAEVNTDGLKQFERVNRI